MSVIEKIKEKRDHRKKGPMCPDCCKERGFPYKADKKMRSRDCAIDGKGGYHGDQPLTVKEQKDYEERLAEDKRLLEEGKRAWKEKKANDPPRAGSR